MTRVLELLVSLLIVFVLVVVVGALLPAHGHLERTVEVSSPLRQIYDSVNTFRRFPEWSSLRGIDPQTTMHARRSRVGTGRRASNGPAQSPQVGEGALEIASTEQDSKVAMALTNAWSGENKTYTITLVPSQNGKTVTINWAYDAEYGWNLMWRYAGLYINGDPASQIQTNLNNIAAMLASFPNVDYKDQKIDIADVTAKPVLVVATKAKRSLDEVAEATDTAMTEIEAVAEEDRPHPAGPLMTITTNWGEEDYAFSVAMPVERDHVHAGQAGVHDRNAGAADRDRPATTSRRRYKTGDKDDDGLLVVDGNVRAAMWYQGKALVTELHRQPRRAAAAAPDGKGLRGNARLSVRGDGRRPVLGRADLGAGCRRRRADVQGVSADPDAVRQVPMVAKTDGFGRPFFLRRSARPRHIADASWRPNPPRYRSSGAALVADARDDEPHASRRQLRFELVVLALAQRRARERRVDADPAERGVGFVGTDDAVVVRCRRRRIRRAATHRNRPRSDRSARSSITRRACSRLLR